MNNPLLTDDFKLTSYWWDATPQPDLPPQALPAKADVVVIGAGYTGLCAALRDFIDPTIAAISTIMIVVSTTLLLATQFIGSRKK